MSRLPVFSSVDAQRMLRKLGIEPVQTKEVHGEFYYGGLHIATFTFPPAHGRRKDLSLGERKSIENASMLSRRDFIDLVKCPMGLEGYVTALKEIGAIPPDESDVGATVER